MAGWPAGFHGDLAGRVRRVWLPVRIGNDVVVATERVAALLGALLVPQGTQLGQASLPGYPTDCHTQHDFQTASAGLSTLAGRISRLLLKFY